MGLRELGANREKEMENNNAVENNGLARKHTETKHVLAVNLILSFGVRKPDSWARGLGTSLYEKQLQKVGPVGAFLCSRELSSHVFKS